MRASRPAGRPLKAALAHGVWAALLVVSLGACSRGGTSRSNPAPVDPAVRGQALIDAGNQAFRAGDFRLAARRYAAAAVEKPDDAAAYYGLGMALAKLGRDEDARTAYAKARELAHRQQQP